MFNQKLYFNKKTIFSNRISVSPMCQYKSLNGFPSDWHYHHLRNLMETGAGSLTVESTSVSKIGKKHGVKTPLNDLMFNIIKIKEGTYV